MFIRRSLRALGPSFRQRFYSTGRSFRTVKDYSKFAGASGISVALLWYVTQHAKVTNDSQVRGTDIVTFEELQKHNRADDCWIAVHNKVYDVTEFLANHPGGAARILRFAGADASKGFESMHTPQYLERHLPSDSFKGEIHDLPQKKRKSGKRKTTSKKQKKAIQRVVIVETNEEEDEEEIRQKLISKMPPLTSILSLSDFEYVAKRVLPPAAWGYLSTGADDEFTLRENHYALGRIFFRPKCLVDVSNSTIDHSVLGEKMEAPFYIGAFCGSKFVQSEGEKVLTRAAGNEGLVHLIPKHGHVKLDQLHEELKPEQVVFYQHDFYTREEVEQAPELLKHIEETYPNVKAVFLNSDISAVGNREKDSRIRGNEGGELVNDLDSIITSSVTYENVTWDDFLRLKSATKLPIIIKGLQRKEDVIKAAELGFRGAVISNHGGRQLDFSTSPIETLAQVKELMKEKKIDDKNFQLFVEGGFRRGTDLIKALCLGATPGIGRGFLYSEVYGQQGVERAIQLLKQEISRDMKLLGANSVAELNEEFLDLSSLELKFYSANDRGYDRNYTPMLGPRFGKSK